MNDGADDRRRTLAALEQSAEPVVAAQDDLGRGEVRVADALGRRGHRDGARHEILIAAPHPAVENDLMSFGALLQRGHGARHLVADGQVARESQILRQNAGPRPRQPSVQQAGHQGLGAHGLRGHLAWRQGQIHMKGVDVARHQGEGLHVSTAQAACDGQRRADRDLVVGLVGKGIHARSVCLRHFRSAACFVVEKAPGGILSFAAHHRTAVRTLPRRRQ